MFTTSGSKQIYNHVYSEIKVIHDCSMKHSDVLSFFSPLIHFSREPFLSFLRMYELTVCLVHLNLYCPEVLEGEESVLWSYILNVPIELSVSSLCDMLNLPKKCEHVFLYVFHKFALLSKTNFEVTKFYFLYRLSKKSSPPNSNSNSSYFKTLIDNIVAQASHKDFFHP